MKWTTLLIIIISFTVCKGQTTDAEKQLTSLHQQVRFRDQAVEYRANIQMGACNFELLINDLPVEQYFGDTKGTFNTSTPINDAILKSGMQHWKLIVYPGEVNVNQATGLSPNVLIDIDIERIVKGAKAANKKPMVTKLLSTPLVTKNGTQVFAAASQGSVVYEGSFSVQVPYDLTGWTQGRDLRKEDPVKLQQEVLAFYQKYTGFYREKNIDGILSAVLAKERERAQYFFLAAAACKETVREYKEFLSFPSPTVLPVEQYKMRFYGDGKIVALERIDALNKGEPVTRLEYKDKNGKTITEFMYCYLMRNASGQLVMIR